MCKNSVFKRKRFLKNLKNLDQKSTNSIGKTLLYSYEYPNLEQHCFKQKSNISFFKVLNY